MKQMTLPSGARATYRAESRAVYEPHTPVEVLASIEVPARLTPTWIACVCGYLGADEFEVITTRRVRWKVGRRACTGTWEKRQRCARGPYGANVVETRTRVYDVSH